MNKKTILSFLLLINLTLMFGQDISVEHGFIDGENYKDNVVYKTVNGSDLVMDIFYPDAEKMKAKNPWVVFIHGGGWAGGHRDNIYKFAFLGGMKKLVEAGVVVANIQYRLAKSPVTSYESVIDCKDAARFLIKNAATYQLDENNYGVWGGSAGGHLSLVTGLVPDDKFPGDANLADVSPDYKGVVAYYPFTSCLYEPLRPNSIFADGTLFDRLLGGAVEDNLELATNLSPTEFLSASSAPTLVIHGENDSTLPVINAEYIKQVGDANSADVEIIKVANAEHSFSGNISPSIEDIDLGMANFFLEKFGYETIEDEDDVVSDEPAVGDTFVDENNLKYTVTSLSPNEAEVYGFDNPLIDAIATVVIPNTSIDARTSTTYDITAIGQAAFSGSSNSKRSNAGASGNHVITSVTLPSSVKHLKIHAFRDLPNLTTINLDNVVSTENSIFATMPLLSDIGSLESMETLGSYAIFGCLALENIDVGASLTTIGSNFLSGSTTLTDIYYNWSSTELVTVNFDSANYLGDVDASTVTIHVPIGTKTDYMNSDFFLIGMTIVEDVVFETPEIGDVFVDNNSLKYTVTSLSPNEAEVYGFNYPLTDARTSVVIPEMVKDTRTSTTYSVTAIGQAAFSGSSNSKRSNAGASGNHVITSVTLPSSVKHLKIHAFRDLPNLTTINLDNVISTENSIFATMPLLSDVGSLESMETLGDYAIFGCPSLKEIRVGSSLTSVGSFFVADSGITDIYYEWTAEQLAGVTMTTGNYLRTVDLSTVTIHVPDGTTADYMNSEFYLAGMTILDDVVLSTDKVAKELGFKLYPNPIKDILTLENNKLEITKVTIIDMNGRVLLTTKTNNSLNHIDLSRLASGIYLLKVSTSNYTFEERIIKQ